jgi:hypothetical protein
MDFETPAWMGRGFYPRKGTLSFAAMRLRFEADGAIVFDALVSELDLRWPWYGFGCQFWAHANGEKYFVSALHPINTLITWWSGIKRGRMWRRALRAAGY